MRRYQVGVVLQLCAGDFDQAGSDAERYFTAVEEALLVMAFPYAGVTVSLDTGAIRISLIFTSEDRTAASTLAVEAVRKAVEAAATAVPTWGRLIADHIRKDNFFLISKASP